MKKKNLVLIIIIAVVVIVVLWLVGYYNSFVRADQAVENQWAQVETQYQRRFDLIPNLVESVKGVLTQEQKVFGDLAEARTRYSGAASVEDKVKAANQLESVLGRLLVIVERYPELKSAETMQQMMAQLEGTENRVSVERKRYNDRVKEYNIRVKTVPGNVLASLFGFTEKTFFEAAAGAEKAPEVKF